MPSAVSEPFSELIGCPISWSLTTSSIRLELRPLPSTGIIRLPRYYGPLRHPQAPGLSLTGLRLALPDHASGLPVLRALSLVYMLSPLPRRSDWVLPSLTSPAVSAFPGLGAGSACASTFSRLARRSLALRPAHSRGHQFVTRFTRGFNHFVTSIVAPVASGWSGCRVGLSPTGKRGGPHRLDHLAAFLRWTPQFLLPPVREILRGGEPEGKVPLRMFFQASVHLLRRRPSVRRVRSLAVV